MREPLPKEYWATSYKVLGQSPFVLRIGESSPDLDRLLTRHHHLLSAYLTACNPGPARLSTHQNAARMARLIQRLDQLKLTHLPAIGQSDHTDYAEQSLLVLGLSEPDAVQLAREWGQHAILIGELAQPIRLVDCRK